MMSRLISAVAMAALLGFAAPAQAARSPAPGPQAAGSAHANQFANEADARSHCPSDTVVWLNTKSRVYHLPGTAEYGKTKHGAFMCRADADSAHRYHVAKNEAQGSAQGSVTPPAGAPAATPRR